jgi:predicted dehydrogenase
MTLRIGVIGVGGIAQARHLPALMKNEKVKVQSVFDTNTERASEVALSFGELKVYENIHRLLEEVDAAVICTPNKFHAEIAIQALESGVHVLCEKPMAINSLEGEAMLQAAEKSGKILMIGFHYRFMKEVIAAKRVIDDGEVGHPLVVRIQALRRRKIPGWGVFTNRELQGGGCLIDFGCHLLDSAFWLLGNPQPIAAMGNVYNSLGKTPGLLNEWGEVDAATFNVEDHAVGMINMENGATVIIESSWAANIKEDKQSLSISGTKGGLDVFPFQLYQEKHGLLLNSHAHFIPGGEEDPGVAQMNNFVNSCLGFEEPVVKPEEALMTTRVIDAIYQSSQTGQSISILKAKGVTHK